MIEEKYSAKSEKLFLGEFVLTRVLNSDAEIGKIWLLGKFRRDPTDNQAIVVLNRQEFPEARMSELFPATQPKNGAFKQLGVAFDQYFHNNEWRKCWVDLPADLNKVQSDIIYPVEERIIAKYTR